MAASQLGRQLAVDRDRVGQHAYTVPTVREHRAGHVDALPAALGEREPHVPVFVRAPYLPAAGLQECRPADERRAGNLVDVRDPPRVEAARRTKLELEVPED